MKTAVSAKVLIQGLVRSPDREGALAHLDPERGFAFVARGAMSFSDVVDPTIWVKEKLSLAFSSGVESEEPPLRRAIATLRSVHGELMARPERERAWISVLLLLLGDGDSMALVAGDCPCYRFRAGVLARLGRAPSQDLPGAPAGALGSEPQVKLEMIPLNPQQGDVYIIATHPMREGELAVLARDLASAREEASLLRTAIAGAPDKGRVAVGIFAGGRADPASPDRTPRSSTEGWPGPSVSVPPADVELEEEEPLELEPLEPVDSIESYEEPEPPRAADAPRAAEPPPYVFGKEGPRADPAGLPASIAEPPRLEPANGKAGNGITGEGRGAVAEAGSGFAVGPGARAMEEPANAGAMDKSAGAAAAGGPSGEFGVAPSLEEFGPAPEVELPPRPSRAFGDRRPWYEWAALWGGGAFAIVALVLLIRAILPGILGSSRAKAPPVVMPLGTGAFIDVFSDPPGAAIRIDGVTVETRTPATGVAIAPGRHRIELNWGVYGVRLDTVEVALGARVTLRPRLLGSVGFRSTDPSRVLDVYVDGAHVGTTPVVLDSLVVGRHLVRFGGPGLNTTAQEVEVLQGTHVELFGNAGPQPEKGRVTIRSALLSDTGFESGRGDPIWVDGEMRGVTPLTVELKPGMHSFRVVRRDFPPQISVLDVRPGGEQFINAEFGAQSEEPLRFAPPAALSRSNPLPFTIALPETEWDQSMTVWLCAAAPGGSFQARRMTRIDEPTKSFAALLPPEVLRNASRQVKVYFKAAGAAGRELYSEIYTLPVKD